MPLKDLESSLDKRGKCREISFSYFSVCNLTSIFAIIYRLVFYHPRCLFSKVSTKLPYEMFEIYVRPSQSSLNR